MYAEQTSVAVEKSRAELERILQRYGATRFAYMCEDSKAVVGFVAKGKMVKFNLPLPDRNDPKFWITPTRKRHRSENEAFLEWEQACRSRWRSLCLAVKAKLEAVSTGITSFEAEFLAHFVMPDGRTFGELAIPQIEEAARTGRMPTTLLLGNGSHE